MATQQHKCQLEKHHLYPQIQHEHKKIKKVNTKNKNIHAIRLGNTGLLLIYMWTQHSVANQMTAIKNTYHTQHTKT